MPNLLAMSFEGELTPSFDLRCLHPGRKPPDGWGIAYYAGREPFASVLKEPAPPQGSIRSELVKAWEHVASSLLLLHIRTATWGHISEANTQPFVRSWGGRDWLFAHSGSLDRRLVPPDNPLFQPVGSTDTELVFCELMSRIARRGWRNLGDVAPEVLRDWLAELNEFGSVTCVLSDGRDLCVYADGRAAEGRGGLHVWHVYPPYGVLAFGDADLLVDLTKRGIKSRKGVLISSNPLALDASSTTTQPAMNAAWERLEPGHLLIIRQGAVRAKIPPRAEPVAHVAEPSSETSSHAPAHLEAHSAGRHAEPGVIPSSDLAPSAPRVETSERPVATRHAVGARLPTRAEPRRFHVRHRTSYRYQRAVERSTHALRLVPFHDRLQTLISNQVTLSVAGKSRQMEDVFGNQLRRVLIETPFTELVIEANSVVEVLDTDPMNFGQLRARSTIPLVWMPWQRHMLQPFLLPPELPESELRELVEYAMSFVERNDYDLLDTLMDINTTIYKEYTYRQGSTTLGTSAFDVYANRRGVCQDFTNLFICLARLLGVPARYTCGYIYCGPKNPNQVQSEASHAWVQVYLPEVGWKGFDPTNGIVTQTDHVRVAVGRNFVDATPTAGTIFVGGGPETLLVDVRVDALEPSEMPAGLSDHRGS